MSLLDGGDGGELIVGLAVFECVFEFALQVVVRREGVPCAVGAGVELEQLVRHVLHGLLARGPWSCPLLRAELVQHRRRTGVGGTIFLDEVEARERDVELGLLGEFEDHELDGKAILHDFFQALILRDAVFDVDYVVTDGEVAEVGEERSSFGFLWLGPRGYVCIVRKIVGTKQNQIGVSETHSS